MREILFKAKRVDNGEWVEGDLITEIHDRKPIEEKSIHCQVDNDKSGSFIRVDPTTVCQFTGLTDKNGKEIWEGDILEIEGMKFTVVYLDGSFRLMFSNDKNRGQLYQERSSKLEVIGNIHDKKEE